MYTTQGKNRPKLPVPQEGLESLSFWEGARVGALPAQNACVWDTTQQEVPAGAEYNAPAPPPPGPSSSSSLSPELYAQVREAGQAAEAASAKQVVARAALTAARNADAAHWKLQAALLQAQCSHAARELELQQCAARVAALQQQITADMPSLPATIQQAFQALAAAEMEVRGAAVAKDKATLAVERSKPNQRQHADGS